MPISKDSLERPSDNITYAEGLAHSCLQNECELLVVLILYYDD